MLAGHRSAGVWLGAAVALAVLLFAALLMGRLSHPLLWHDEAETAIFGRRVLEYGYPKVHGARNVVYSLWQRGGVGIHEPSDAYTGSPWAQYYLGALGMALANVSEDLYARTAWMRLPFAAVGAAGLALLAAAAWPALGSRRRRLIFAALYLLALAYSVSLILHLREMRHYPLTVFCVGALAFVFLRRQVFGALGYRAYAAWTTGLLFLLFQTFFPAFAVLLIAMGISVAVRCGSRPQPVRGLLREGLPLLLAAAAALPFLAFFDFLEQTRSWVARFSEPGLYLRNLSFVVSTLFRFEWLAPALLLRFAVVSLRSSPGKRSEAPDLAARLDVASFAMLVVVVWALVVAQAPFLFERYFVALSPLITLAALLDAFSLADLLRSGLTPFGRRFGSAVALLATLACAAGVWVRAPEFAGRLGELRRPYRGPLDFVIPYLAERYPDPSELVIATNYEGPAYMVYLDCRVTVGFYGADLERDRTTVPDVIVPRPWPEQLEVLEELAGTAVFDETRFPVQNLPWNNNPALSPRADHPTAHRFATPLPVDGAPQLVILERRR